MGTADVRVAETLNVFQRAFVGRQTDLPLPSSLLIDSQGRVAVIYKGAVTVEQLTADIELLDLPYKELKAAAMPLPGSRSR